MINIPPSLVSGFGFKSHLAFVYTNKNGQIDFWTPLHKHEVNEISEKYLTNEKV